MKLQGDVSKKMAAQLFPPNYMDKLKADPVTSEYLKDVSPPTQNISSKSFFFSKTIPTSTANGIGHCGHLVIWSSVHSVIRSFGHLVI